jgi:DNA modification methylase
MNIESTNVLITDEARNGRSAICYAHLYHADCFDIMPKIESKSIDLILADLPYGTTACKWDSVLPLDKLWNEYKRIIKDNGAIVLTASQPFTSILVCSNLDMFRYEWIYSKSKSTGFMNANKMPMKQHESILVFYKKLPIYNQLKTFVGIKDKRKTFNPAKLKESNIYNNAGIKNNVYHKKDDGWQVPKSIIHFNNGGKMEHPTQKPVELLKYLIKTYTNKGMTILDNTMGSGSTGVAAKMLQRNFIGIEKELNYFEIAQKRIDNTIIETSIFDCA